MSAKSVIVTSTDTISPKVFWPLAVSVVLTFVATFLSAVTPEMLGVLGPLAFPMGLALGAVSQTIVGYMKNDSLRATGAQAAAAVLPVYDDQVSPATDVAPPYVEPKVDDSPLSFEDSDELK